MADTANQSSALTPDIASRKFQYHLVFLDRIELRTNGAALAELNSLGAQGWRIVHIKEDPLSARDLAVFMEREIPRN